MDIKQQFPSQDPLIRLRQEMKLRNFSQKIIKSYLYYIISLLDEQANRSIKIFCGKN
ncbi:MAG: hypothetical protein BWY53_00389 [Parcubacteria group bacterium ADurb.Bin326]|nr:MAG: hypothetical protein BWY53_00389 [Parcubacteria group bacterium ADurb.Bin326]